MKFKIYESSDDNVESVGGAGLRSGWFSVQAPVLVGRNERLSEPK